MGENKPNLENLPEPPVPRPNLFSLFNVNTDRRLFDIFNASTPKGDAELSMEKIKELTIPPKGSKKKGFVYPVNPEFEEMHRRHLEYLDEMKRKHDQELRERHSLLDEKEKDLKGKEYELVTMERDSMISGIRLKKFIEEIDEKTRNLREKERSIGEREKMLKAQESERSAENEAMEEKYIVLKKELDQMNLLKLHLDEEIKKRREQTDGIKQDYISDSRALRDTEKLIAMREKEILVAVSRLEEDKKMLNLKEDEIIGKLKKLEDEKKMLDAKEDEVIKRIISLEKVKDQVKGEQLKFQRKIEEQKDDIKERQKAFLARVDSELKKLAAKKEEQDKIFASRKESFDKMVKDETEDLKSRGNALKQLEKDIKIREQKVDTAKELKENIDRLKGIYSDMVKQYSNLKKDFLKTQSLADKEKEMVKMKGDLMLREKMLYAIDEKLKQKKHDIDDLEYSAYASTVKQIPMLSVERPRRDSSIVEDKKAVEEEKDIFKLISATRLLIKDGEYDTAKLNIKRIKRLFAELEMDKGKKNVIFYDIMELQNEIELSTL